MKNAKVQWTLAARKPEGWPWQIYILICGQAESLHPSHEIIERKKDVRIWTSFCLAEKRYTLGRFDQGSHSFYPLRFMCS
jgi:hypothetical protein